MSTKRYTVSIKVTDTTTGKDGDIVLQTDDPKSLSGIVNLVEAVCEMINMSPEELKDLQQMTQDLINKHKN